MTHLPPITPDVLDAKTAQEKLDQLLQDQTSWVGEVGNSLERSEDHIKQRMQYFDRLAVLSGAILAFSVPAFTSLRGSVRTITYRHISLGVAIGGWVCLFFAIVGSAAAHYLLVELYAVWTTEHERSIQSVLFHNVNLLQKRLMRTTGGNLDQLKPIPVPALSFQRQSWHERLPYLLAIVSRVTIAACLLGTIGVLLFLIFSSF